MWQMIYMTAPTTEEAQKIAGALVEEKLAACANIFPAHEAVYRWQGKVERAGEVAVILKTRAELFDAAAARIKALHSYDVPCIVALSIEAGYGPFLAWIGEETAGV